jgi:hypothetical protein
MRYSRELQSILSRFGAGDVQKDQVVQYLTRQSSQTTEGDFEDILNNLEDEGYVETVSGKRRARPVFRQGYRRSVRLIEALKKSICCLPEYARISSEGGLRVQLIPVNALPGQV